MHAYTVQRLYKAILGDYSQVSTSFAFFFLLWEEITLYFPVYVFITNTLDVPQFWRFWLDALWFALIFVRVKIFDKQWLSFDSNLWYK